MITNIADATEQIVLLNKLIFPPYPPDRAKVQLFASMMLAGTVFDAIIIAPNDATSHRALRDCVDYKLMSIPAADDLYFLRDGNHRVHAALLLNITSLSAVIQPYNPVTARLHTDRNGSSNSRLPALSPGHPRSPAHHRAEPLSLAN